jgi:hypothetical protein
LFEFIFNRETTDGLQVATTPIMTTSLRQSVPVAVIIIETLPPLTPDLWAEILKMLRNGISGDVNDMNTSETGPIFQNPNPSIKTGCASRL